MPKMITTLNKIKSFTPCVSGWEKLLKSLGKTKADDAPLDLLTILGSNGPDDTLWALRAVDGCDGPIRRYAVWCARQVQHLNTDPRIEQALATVEWFSRGGATPEELDIAYVAARSAARSAADAARSAAYVAADAACSAADAAYAADAACSAAYVAARSAADAARSAARSAADAAAADAAAYYAAAYYAARSAQETELRRLLTKEDY